MNALRITLLTTLHLGRIRPAPGTWGSAFTVVFALGMVLGGSPTGAVNTALLLILALFGVACVAFGPFAETHFGRKDPQEVVADETAGQAIPLLFLPWTPGDTSRNVMLALIAFAAFRLFDVTKPPPIRQIQRVQGGWGILIDDLAAGVLAAILVQVVARTVL